MTEGPRAGNTVLPAALRWDFMLRLFLAVGVPVVVLSAVTGEVSGFIPAVIALFVTVSNLGADLGSVRWSAMTAVGVPLAFVAGGVIVAGPQSIGLGYVVVLFTALGVATLAGLLPKLAFSPVASAGLVAAVILEDGMTGEIALGAVLGAAWGFVLIPVLHGLVRFPRLPVPPGVLDIRSDAVRTMLRHPTLAEWSYPLMLGVLSGAVLVAAALMTDNNRPYWAVFAFISVMGPVAEKTRKAGWQTVVATVTGVGLSVALAAVGLPEGVLVGLSLVMATVGGLILIANGFASKVLLTPLPLVLIALGLGDDLTSVASLRLLEYVFGAGAALLAAGLAEYLATRLESERPDAQEAPVG